MLVDIGNIYIYIYIPLYPIISHYIPLYPIISHYIPLYPIISHYIPLYPIISHYIPLYPIISHYIPLYPPQYSQVLICIHPNGRIMENLLGIPWWFPAGVCWSHGGLAVEERGPRWAQLSNVSASPVGQSLWKKLKQGWLVVFAFFFFKTMFLMMMMVMMMMMMRMNPKTVKTIKDYHPEQQVGISWA